MATRPGILLLAEEAKIALSAQMRNCHLSEDCSKFVFRRPVPLGVYHPEVEFEFVLDGEDLKTVLKEFWWNKKMGWGSTILSTIEKARTREGEVRFSALDAVILAGGSSGLPFLTELVVKTLTAQMDFEPRNVRVPTDFKKAVAFGLALEAREQRRRALRTHNSLGPCVFNRMFLYTAHRRDGPFLMPQIKRVEGGTLIPHKAGTLLSGPMRIGKFRATYEIKLNRVPKGHLFYWFTTNEKSENPQADRLNIRQDVVRLPEDVQKTGRLRLLFRDDGLVEPTFEFGKHEAKVPSFYFAGLRIAKNVDSYAGIDFGTSNTYVVDHWAESKSVETQYPSYRISDSVGNRLRLLEQEIETMMT
jgi:hypothetical protein